MASKDHPLLSTLLCIALLITVLPLLGGVIPADARGASIRTIQSGDIIFLYETGLDLTPLEGSRMGPTALVMVDNRSGAEINRIPVADATRFDVLASQVNGYYGIYHPVNVSGGVFTARFVQIAQPDATLGVVMAGSHTTSLDGKGVAPDANIAFRIASPRVGTTYRTAAGVYEGQLAIEVTSPGGAKVLELGGVPLSPINVSGAEMFTAAIPLKGVEQGTYSAKTKWITPAWKDRTSLESNTVTFTVLSSATSTVTLSGQVTDASGKGITGIWVYFWRQDGRNAFYVKTDSDGKFSAKVEKSSDRTKRYNIAANKDNLDPAHPKNPQFAPAEITNVQPDMDRSGLNFRLTSSQVTLGGVVKDAKGTPLANIWVYYWRQDGKNAFYVKTGADGKFSAKVEKSSATTMRYNIAANKDNNDPAHPRNFEYSTVEKVNVYSSADFTSMEFRLDFARVTLSGKVTDASGKGIAGIWVYFWRQDGRNAFYVQTGADGKFSAKVEKSSATTMRYNIAANKDNKDPAHPKNTLYMTAELNNVVPSADRAGLNFRLESGQVALGGQVTDPSGKPIPDIWVYYWRHDGQDAAYVKNNATGYYTRQVARFPATDTAHRYNLAANKDNKDPAHPKNPTFATGEIVNIFPAANRMNLNFRLAVVA